MNKEISNFVIFPRTIIKNFHAGEINRNELMAISYIRMKADPYGKTYVSLKTLRDDIFSDIKHNTVNKILISLKCKGYIHYENHSGRRGTVTIRNAYWVNSRGSLINTSEEFIDLSDHDLEDNQELDTITTEEIESQIQRTDAIKEDITRLVDTFTVNKSRGDYNDNEN